MAVMSGDTQRGVRLERLEQGRFRATNAAGDSMDVGGEGNFSPIELLLVALAGCTALDVDALTSRRANAEEFVVDASGQKVRDEGGNRLTDLSLAFAVRFPADAAGDAARELLPDALAKSHDRLCTVSRTIELGTAVHVRLDGPAG